jgi:hypothetical protein
MARDVTFPGEHDSDVISGVPLSAGYPLVYTRQRWSDEWVLQQRIHPLEVTWSVAPTLPVATCEFLYGGILEAGNTGYTTVTKAQGLALVGKFIKIVCPAETSLNDDDELETKYRYWNGIIEEANDVQGGADTVSGLIQGRLVLVCYGLEKLLADHVIDGAVCDGGTDGNGDPVFVNVGVPLDFNTYGPRHVIGNKSLVKRGSSFVFGNEPSQSATWSTSNILEYLATHQTPKDTTGQRSIPFNLNVPTALTSFTDGPVLRCQNATTYSLISQLLDRRRVTMWWIDVDEDTQEVNIKADTMVAAQVSGSVYSIPANSDLLTLKYADDPLTTTKVNNSDLPAYHQVIARGARRRSVGSFCYDDDTMEAAWNSADETSYEAGATSHPAGTPLKRKQTRNADRRNDPLLEDVYSLFRIPEDWDFKVAAGSGNTAVPLFKDTELGDPGDDDLLKQCYAALEVEQTLPLLHGVDYSDDAITTSSISLTTDTNEETRPLVFFIKPWTSGGDERWQKMDGQAATDVERIDPKENERIRCMVSVPPRSMTVRLKVHGQPQHAIAFSDFTPISGEDRSVGEFDWQDAIFTLSIESLFHVQATYPDPLTVQIDAVRKKIVDAGEQYRQDYVAPYTVVGIDDDGALIRSDGGYIPQPGSADDPIPKLEDIAKIAAAWYTNRHYVLELESYRLKSNESLPLGALVQWAGAGSTQATAIAHVQEVNAPITQVKFQYQIGGPKKTPPPKMSMKTWAGELDAVSLVALNPMTQPGEARTEAGRVRA